MERDPLRLVWRTTPGLHVVALVLLGAAAVLSLIGIDLVRVAIDDVIGGRAADGIMPFLRLTFPWPAGLGDGPLVLLQGHPLEPSAFAMGAILGLVSIPVLLALLGAGLALLAARIAERAVASLRARVLGAMTAARPAARDEAVQTATLAGEGLARQSGFLGSALIRPVQAGGGLAVALLYLLSVDMRLALAALVGVALDGGLRSLHLRRRRDAAAARSREGRTVEQSLLDLLRRSPALRAHGTSAYERDRLGREIARQHRPARSAQAVAGMLSAASACAACLPTAAVLSAAAWLAPAGPPPSGAIVAAAIAAVLATLAVRRLVGWREALTQMQALLRELARLVAGLQSGERRGAAVALPGAGALTAENLAAYNPVTGTRLSGLDLSIALPAHLALLGDGHTGARLLAALIGGQIDPSGGRLTFGGVDLTAADPADRAGRIAFAGGDTILIPGSLRQNLLYGCLAPEAPGIERRLMEMVRVAGLERLVYARGLAGFFDPRSDPKLAAALIETRKAVRAALAADGIDHLVDPFDRARYNRHATLGENLLFGAPAGDTFREDALAAHPFVRAVLEAGGLTKPLTSMGLAIAANMVEIFAELPDDHPLFERFSFFASAERGQFEDIVARGGQRQRGPEANRERERLIDLALRYNENRHRLGLLTEELEQKLLAARADFATMLPASLQAAIAFYDPDRLASTASLQDNLLFGRIAHDHAAAEEAVHAVVRRVLTERGLDEDVFRIGLASAVDVRGDGLTPHELAAIDLVRCLVRRPDVVVVERVLDGLPRAEAEALVGRLRRCLVGRGLVIVTPTLTAGMDAPPFDAVLHFERSAVARLEDRREQALLEAAPA